MYKVSIILPIFNVENYLERAFQSILNQTMDLKDIEVIMVDDCSTDTTRTIVEKYEKLYSNFKAIYHKKNSGNAGIPRNSGLEIATGKYIMFLDPDDEFSRDMCEVMYNKIEESGVDIVKCNHNRVDSSSFSRLFYMFDKNVPEVTINCNTDVPPGCSVCNIIHRKSFLDEKNIRFKGLKNGEDILFILEEHINTNYLVCLNNYHGYIYHSNETMSHSSRPTEDNLDDVLYSFNLSKKFLESNNRPDIIKHVFSKVFVAFFLRLMNYEGNKKVYLKRLYEFEKSLNVDLNINHTWVNILNKLIMKRHFTLASEYLNTMRFIRNSYLIRIYRKFLKYNS